VVSVTDGIVSYRHFVTNPVGVRVCWKVIPQIDVIEKKSAYKFRQTLKRLKMKREGELHQPETFDHALAAQVEEHRPGPATVIQFPTSRIIRRISHGRGIVVQESRLEAIAVNAGVAVAFPKRPA
jgi:hypothetical protein